MADFRPRCRIGGGPAPCFDDLCHSGSETLCGIPDEWLYTYDEWDGDDDGDTDALYLKLKGAREKLCLAQMLLPPHAAGRRLLGKAVANIDQVGAVWCPQWSKHDRDDLLPEEEA